MKTLISILAVVVMSGFAFADGRGGGVDVDINRSIVGDKNHHNIVGSSVNSGNTNVGELTNNNTNQNCNTNTNKNTNLNNAIANAFSCNSANSKSNSNSNASINIDYENLVQGQAVIPMDLMPRILAKERQENLWNAKFRPLLKGYFTLEELEQRRNDEAGDAEITNVRKSWGKIKSPYEKSPGLIVVEDVPFDVVTDKGYVYVKTINAKGGSKTTEDRCIYEALVAGVKCGGHVAVVTSGLNSIAKSKGAQLGGSGVSAGENGALTGGGGIGGTSAFWAGNPQCKIALFRKAADAEGNVPSLENQVSELLSKYGPQQEVTEDSEPVAFDVGTAVQIADFWLGS